MSWNVLLYAARVPYLLMGLVGLGLLVPPQIPDLLAAISEPPRWGPIGAYALSMGFLAAMCWYWSRAVIAACGDTPFATAAEPLSSATERCVADAPIVLAILLDLAVAWRCGTGVAVSVTGGVLCLILVCVALRQWALQRAGKTQFTVKKPAPASAISRLLHGAPFGPGVARALIALGVLVPLAGAALSKMPEDAAWISQHVGLWQDFLGASPVFVGAGLIVAPLTALVFVGDNHRWAPRILGAPVGPISWPVLTLAVAASLLLPYALEAYAPGRFELHRVRVSGDTRPERPTLEKHFAAWQAACPGKRPIIVAISGGASRAGLWGAAVLARIDEAARDSGAAVYAISSVSGGSLGAAAYLAARAGEGSPCWLARDDGFGRYARTLGQADAIGALLSGWMFSDIPRSILPLPTDAPGGDRAGSIERAFEANAAVAAAEAPGLRPTGFGEPFLAVSGAGHPLWIANGTERDSGSRALTVAVSAPGCPPLVSSDEEPDPARRGTAPEGSAQQRREWPFTGASDVIGLLGRDVPVSTAINNTARFPWLEPAGVLHGWDTACSYPAHAPPVAIIDGGYFDNSGLASALELAQWLREQAAVEPLIVAATGDGDSHEPPSQIVRCGIRYGTSINDRTTQPVLEAWAPVDGLNDVRAGHVDGLLRRAIDAQCRFEERKLVAQGFFHFYLPPLGGESVPLDWALSGRVADFIWSAAAGRTTITGLSSDDLLTLAKFDQRNARELVAFAQSLQPPGAPGDTRPPATGPIASAGACGPDGSCRP